jgi:uncharacterized protein DUF2252
MSFLQTNARFETWLREQCAVVDRDLKAKHKKMASSAFSFLRCTFFQWAMTIEALCPNLSGTTPVRSVGDLHVENFGTWRDLEGRLVWGVNDFDEAAVIPFAFDLVRLATSAQLAPDQQISHREAAEAILDGYRHGLQAPRPTLLDEQETWMRAFVACSDEAREKFWQHVDKYPTAEEPVLDVVVRGLQQSLPPDAMIQRLATRQRGGGSLGRPRYVAVAWWRGGRVMREAKALVPSAWLWAHDHTDAPNDSFTALSKSPYRSPDPFLAVQDQFIFRRVAADSRKVEFETETPLALHRTLLVAMGFEAAALHSQSGSADRIRNELAHLDAQWLHESSKAAAIAVKVDYETWKTDRDRG